MCVLIRVFEPEYLQWGVISPVVLDHRVKDVFLALESINSGKKTRVAVEGRNQKAKAAFSVRCPSTL